VTRRSAELRDGFAAFALLAGLVGKFQIPRLIEEEVHQATEKKRLSGNATAQRKHVFLLDSALFKKYIYINHLKLLAVSKRGIWTYSTK
jgi:hypothetical protein